MKILKLLILFTFYIYLVYLEPIYIQATILEIGEYWAVLRHLGLCCLWE